AAAALNELHVRERAGLAAHPAVAVDVERLLAAVLLAAVAVAEARVAARGAHAGDARVRAVHRVARVTTRAAVRSAGPHVGLAAVRGVAVTISVVRAAA